MRRLFCLTLLCVGLLLLLAGCGLGMHWVFDPMQDRVVKASSGEKFYFRLPSGGDEGLVWSAKSDDPDVDVAIDRKDGYDAVRVRIHRGFDGPATVTFTPRQSAGAPSKDFRIVFYKRTGDEAFWE